MITGSVLCGASDLLAQKVIEKKESLDWTRLLNFMGFGIVIGGIYHPWYKFLDKFYGSSMKFNPAWKKVCSDQFIFAPIEIVSFLAWNHYGTQKDYNFKDKLYETLPDLLIRDYELWIPAQLINFLLVPEHLRVLFMCLVNFVWFSYLSYKSNSIPEHNIHDVK